MASEGPEDGIPFDSAIHLLFPSQNSSPGETCGERDGGERDLEIFRGSDKRQRGVVMWEVKNTTSRSSQWPQPFLLFQWMEPVSRSILGQTETLGFSRHNNHLAPFQTNILKIFVQHLMSGGKLVSGRNFVAIDSFQARSLPRLTKLTYLHFISMLGALWAGYIGSTFVTLSV